MNSGVSGASGTAAPAPFLGILSLDTAFPRIPGDVGNPRSYPFAARVRVVKGADSVNIVQRDVPSEALTARFVEAALELEAQGAAALISTCGFLVRIQSMVAAAVRVPVMLSALSLCPIIRAIHASPVCIITASRAALTPETLVLAGIDPAEAHVIGMEDAPAFAQTFLVSKSAQPGTLDEDAVRSAVLERARASLSARPEIGAFLLECANLPPYAGALREATGRPVFHLVDAARLLMSASAR